MYKKKRLFLCRITHHAMKMEGGDGGRGPSYLTSALHGSEWLASRPVRFAPQESARRTHWIGGSVGSRVGLDSVEKRKILHLPRF
jgi:hypothetical protein